MAKALVGVLLLLGAAASGCSTFGDSSGKAYELDLSKIGTGQQAIVPVDDATHMNGQPLDLRPKR